MTLPSDCTASTSSRLSRIAPARFREAWLSGERRADMSKRFGLSDHAITKRAKAMGLPLRGFKTKKPSIGAASEPLFRAMWVAGVGMPEMAAHFAVDRRTISNTRERLGLLPRQPGARPRMTLTQFFEVRLSEQMAMSARLEAAALINAEMVDQIGRGLIKRMGVVK